jgi:hypothetical protein
MDKLVETVSQIPVHQIPIKDLFLATEAPKGSDLAVRDSSQGGPLSDAEIKASLAYVGLINPCCSRRWMPSSMSSPAIVGCGSCVKFTPTILMLWSSVRTSPTTRSIGASSRSTPTSLSRLTLLSDTSRWLRSPRTGRCHRRTCANGSACRLGSIRRLWRSATWRRRSASGGRPARSTSRLRKSSRSNRTTKNRSASANRSRSRTVARFTSTFFE